jgi:hypothetical protein
LVPNYSQTNSDGNPSGDACDLCPDFYGVDNGEPDNDGQGNSCDTDDDNDGLLDTTDNCPQAYNPDQRDLDGDGKGWACDSDDAADLLNKLKILTLHYNWGFPVRIPLPGCGICGPGYIDPRYFQNIDLVSEAGFHAYVVDSSGIIVAHTSPGAPDLLKQSLHYTPEPYAAHLMQEGIDMPDEAGTNLASDSIRYYLELIPAESVDLGQDYSLSILVQEGIETRRIYLPTVIKMPKEDRTTPYSML